MTGFANLIMANIDTADPAALAEFYHHVLGWKVTHSEAEYAMITDGTASVGSGGLTTTRLLSSPTPAAPSS